MRELTDKKNTNRIFIHLFIYSLFLIIRQGSHQKSSNTGFLVKTTFQLSQFNATFACKWTRSPASTRKHLRHSPASGRFRTRLPASTRKSRNHSSETPASLPENGCVRPRVNTDPLRAAVPAGVMLPAATSVIYKY